MKPQQLVGPKPQQREPPGSIGHQATRGVAHLTTAGTSWIEALRVVAAHDPALLRDILKLSLQSFEENRASYHLSCDPARIPADPRDDQMDALVTDTDSRQVLHVGYGPVLERYGTEIKGLLVDHEDSFVHTLGNYFRQTGAEVTTLRAEAARAG